MNSKDEHGHTPLAIAASSPDAGEAMLHLLIESGADVNMLVEKGRHFPLELAASSGDFEKVRLLLKAGADIKQVSEGGYSVLVRSMYDLHSEDSLVPMLELLIEHGAEIDGASDYGESPVIVALKIGRLDAVRFLLDAGADASPLRWSPLLTAIAVGTLKDVAKQLDSEAGLDEKDEFSSPPIHLAALVGDVEKAQLLFDRRHGIDRMDRLGETALSIAAANGKVGVLHWLIEKGANLEVVNGMDCTPLMLAAQTGQTECVRLLLEAGADPSRQNQFQNSAMSSAANAEIVRLLLAAGQDLAATSKEMKRQLVGLPEDSSINASVSDFRAGRKRIFGRSNPNVMEIPFWHAMVRAGVNAYQARKQFGETDYLVSKVRVGVSVYQARRQFEETDSGSGPVWCFDRFGMSITELPDGRFVQIGGEHEDFYDPDFCIYNEVVFHDPSGSFEIMGYPEDVFPPTDFHTATYLNGSIYIVGGLGYQGSRRFGVTPVYCLNCRTRRIEAIKTSGDNPGWIYEHRTSLESSHHLIVKGGKICKEIKRKEQVVENDGRFVLDLTEMKWLRL